MKKTIYMLLLAGATLSISACNRTKNLEGTGIDAEGNLRKDPVGRGDGAPINQEGTGTTGQGNLEGQTAPGGTVVENAGEQKDVSTGSGLNPARTDADTVPGTGRTGTQTQTQTGTDARSPGDRGTAPNTNPTRR